MKLKKSFFPEKEQKCQQQDLDLCGQSYNRCRHDFGEWSYIPILTQHEIVKNYLR